MRAPFLDEAPFASLVGKAAKRKVKVSIVTQPERTLVRGQYISCKLKLLENGDELTINSATYKSAVLIELRAVAGSSNGLIFEVETDGGRVYIVARLYNAGVVGPRELVTSTQGQGKQVLEVYDVEKDGSSEQTEEEDNWAVALNEKNELVFFLKVMEGNIPNGQKGDPASAATNTSNSNANTKVPPEVPPKSRSSAGGPAGRSSSDSGDRLSRVSRKAGCPAFQIVFFALNSSESSSDRCAISRELDVYEKWMGELMELFKLLFRSVRKKKMKQLDNTPEVYKEQSTRRAFKEHKLKLKSGEMSNEGMLEMSEEFVIYYTELIFLNEGKQALQKLTLSGNSLIHFWALLGYNHPILTTLVQNTPDVDGRNMNGCTPLHFTALSNHCDMAKLLLHAKADAKIKDYRGETAMDYAAHLGNKEMSDLLQAYCTSHEDWDESSGVVPLLTATFNGEEQAVHELISSGVQVDTCDPYGATALHVAALYGHEGCMKALLAAHADINRTDNDGGTALHKAAYAGQEECARILLEAKAKIDAKDNNGATPLHVAAYKNRLNVGTLLLEAGAPTDVKDNTGCTPLHQTAGQGHLPFTIKLIESNASLVEKDPNGATPLHLACFNGRPACVKVLIEHGAPLDDIKLVHHTAFYGHLDCLQQIMGVKGGKKQKKKEKFFDVNHKDEEGSTPLHKAAFNGHADVLRFLMQQGADPSARDEEGAYPLHQAAFNGHTECISALIDNNASVKCVDAENGTPLHNASFNGHVEAVAMLLKASADPNNVDNIGQSALHLAAQNGHTECMKVLLKGGALDEPDSDGMTALHHASDHVEAVELLLDHGYAMDVQEQDERTPLHLAVENRREDVVRLLIRRGADTSIKNKDGQTCFDIAEDYMRNVLENASKDKENTQDSAVRKLFEEAATKFNKKPKDGIKFLMENYEMDGDKVTGVVHFLHNATSLSKTQLGDMLGENDELSVKILEEFIRQMDFTKLEFDVALRLFLSKFRLPGEAQKIDRIMEKFAQRYCSNNPIVFGNEDLAYMLAFSLIMLNTDLHNPSIKNKMTKDQFIRNNSNTGLGEDLPEEFLSQMYDNIAASEIKMEQEESVFGNSLVVKSGWMTKQGGRIKTWKKRWFILSDNCVYYFKDKQEEKSKACGIIPLEDMQVRPAKNSGKKYCFELYNPRQEGEIKAMKRVDGTIQKGHHSSYMISAGDEKVMNDWIEAIKQNSFTNPYMQLIMKKKMQKEKLQQIEKQQNRGSYLTKSGSKGRPVSVSISNEGLAARPDFNEINLLVSMLRVSYLGEKGIQESYGKFAVVEQPYKGINFFFLINQSFKLQTIAISGLKWENAEELLADVNKYKQTLHERYNIEGTAKHIRKTGLKYLRRDYTTSISGHGVGGSVAVALGLLMQKRGFNVSRIVTFGAPTLLPEKSAEVYTTLPVLRVVIHGDPIPDLYPGYRHVGKKIILLAGEHYTDLGEPEMCQGSLIVPEYTDDILKANAVNNYSQNVKGKMGNPVRVKYDDRDNYVLKQ